MNVIYYADPTEVDQGAAGTRTIAGLKTAIGSSKEATIVLTHTSSGNTTTYTLSTSLTLTSNIHLKIDRGAVLSIATGKTLTVNGSFDAGLYQVFSCAGTGNVLFDDLSVDKVIPQWFGAKGDYTTIDTAAIQLGLDSTQGQIPFFFPPGGYVIDKSLTFPKDTSGRALTGTIIYGTGTSSVLINAATASTNPTFADADTVRGLVMHSLCFVGKTTNANVGLQFAVIESSELYNLSFDTYGHGIYITTHAMDLKLHHLYFWWDILSDILGYTTSIRTASVTQNFDAIKICNGESDGSTYWANDVYIDYIWTNGGVYGIHSTPRTSYGIYISHVALDKHDVAIYLANAYRSSIKDSYLSDNSDHATNRLITLKNCRNVTIENTHDDHYDPASSSILAYGSIRVEGSSSDNITIKDVDSSGYLDLHTDIEGYTVINVENSRFTGGCKNATRSPYYMSAFYARNYYIKAAGGDGLTGYVNTQPPNAITLANDATPSIAGLHGADGKCVTGGTTTITDIDDGRNYQMITILSEHAITITDGTNIFLNGSANFVMKATDTLTIIQKADGNWYEVARSVN